MSETNPQQEAPPESELIQPTHYPADETLVTWVHNANKYDLTLNITLQMNGVLVSGTLISFKKYNRLMGELLDKILPGDGRSWVDVYTDDSFDSDADNQLPSFIHLTDVAFVQLEGQTPKLQIAWRGRLSQVDGWWFGVLQKESR